MKKLIFIIAFFMFSCGTVEVKISETFKLTNANDPDDTMSCTIGLTNKDGFKMNGKCIGHYEKDGNKYTCSIDVGSDDKPVSEFFRVEQDCEIVVVKK